MVKKSDESQPATKRDIKILADKTNKKFDLIDKKFEKTNKKIDDTKNFLSQEIIILDKRIDEAKITLNERIDDTKRELKEEIIDLREEMWLKDKRDEVRFKELKLLITQMISKVTDQSNNYEHRIRALESASSVTH